MFRTVQLNSSTVHNTITSVRGVTTFQYVYCRLGDYTPRKYIIYKTIKRLSGAIYCMKIKMKLIMMEAARGLYSKTGIAFLGPDYTRLTTMFSK